MSSITAYAEAAYITSRATPNKLTDLQENNNGGTDKGGQVYIDDFEGTSANIDLRFPLISWSLASIPQGNNNLTGTAPLFPESALNNDSSSAVIIEQN